MKRAIAAFIILISVVCSHAQTPSWLWAEGPPSAGNYEWGFGVSVDTLNSSLFAGGRCAGTNTIGGMTMTPGGADNPFFGRFDENGNAKWLSVNPLSGGYDYPWGFWRDNNDNTYSDGVVSSGQSFFVDKYNSAGAQQWSITAGSFNMNGHGVAVDGAGCVYVTGDFHGTITLGSTTLNYAGPNEAIFVAKLDPAGNFLWAQSAYGTGANDGYDEGRSITIDNNANIYISGGYIGAPVFGTITAPTSSGYSNLFIAEYDSSGNALNVITASSAGFPSGDCCDNNGITVDSCGYIYVTGFFQNTAQFGSFLLTSGSPQDVYIAKCSNSGTWLWANSINCTGGTGGNANAIALDKYTNVYVGASYTNGTAILGSTTVSGGDMLVAKYDNGTGNLDWVQTAGTASNGDGGPLGITVDNKGFVYINGDYLHSASFGATTLTDPSTQTIFIAELDTPIPITIIPTPDSTYCAGQIYTLPYSIIGTFNSGNIFTAELSNSAGSFNPPDTIGSVSSTTSGTISITIPNSAVYGTHYLIKIVSSNPIITNTSPPTSTCHVYPPADTTYFYITIYPMPKPLITGIDTICQHDSTTLTASGGTTYLWSNGSTDSSITVSPSGTTQYIISVSNGSCIVKDSVTVKVDSIQLTVQPKDTTIIFGDSLKYQASGAVSYKWSPDTALSCDSCSNPTASPTITTTYIVTGTSSAGCITMDTVIVIVKPILCNAKLLANAFTPGNAESGNNMLYIQNQIALSQLQVFRIYNRWGELVFQTNDINAGWDGTFNGSPEPIGVYVWYIEGICRGHSVLQTGNVTLLR